MCEQYKCFNNKRNKMFFVVYFGSSSEAGYAGYASIEYTTPIYQVCHLPAQPDHGNYIVLNSYSDSGQVSLNYVCDNGFALTGIGAINCKYGIWSSEFPKCVKGCSLNYYNGIFYTCKDSEGGEFTRYCDSQVPENTEILPQCNAPHYVSTQELTPMTCVNGIWNYSPKCIPECGIANSQPRITREGSSSAFVAGGRTALNRELPWHAGIYNKKYMPYMQICSGSIISTKLVVTAAHCFWSDLEGLQSPSNFAVAAGKVYRPWNNSYDAFAQHRDVADIKIPPRFRGAQTNFQDDIAIMILSEPLVFDFQVRRVCVDFDVHLDREQLIHGNLGKVAGWGLTSEFGKASPTLQVVELPYVDIGQCISDASPDFRSYITSDKVCAGYTNGTSLCKGDSGGGLAFPRMEGGVIRYYLRGIASTAPNNDQLCNTHAVTTFTQILAHEHFINDYFKGDESEI